MYPFAAVSQHLLCCTCVTSELHLQWARRPSPFSWKTPNHLCMDKKGHSSPHPSPCGIKRSRSNCSGYCSLNKGEQGLTSLTQEVNDDLGHLEQAINHLYDQVQSLAEVVLRNHRGLDLLFIPQGGLYMALGEVVSSMQINLESLRVPLPK